MTQANAQPPACWSRTGGRVRDECATQAPPCNGTNGRAPRMVPGRARQNQSSTLVYTDLIMGSSADGQLSAALCLPPTPIVATLAAAAEMPTPLPKDDQNPIRQLC